VIFEVALLTPVPRPVITLANIIQVMFLAEAAKREANCQRPQVEGRLEELHLEERHPKERRSRRW
jgi:hypothetical protein